MSLALTLTERLARARGDLRMGVPVVLVGEGAALVVAVEELTAARLDDLRGYGQPVIALTNRRAETLKARAYDGDLARRVVPPDQGIDWVRSLADPADDLRRVSRNSSRPTRPHASANRARSRKGKVLPCVRVRVGGCAVRHAFHFVLFFDVHAMHAMHALVNGHWLW